MADGTGYQTSRRGRNISGGDDMSEKYRKLFIGGLSYETTDDSLRTYFEGFGEVADCIVMKDPVTKRSRGFGFVTFESTQSLDDCQSARPHTIDGRIVDSKRAMPRTTDKTAVSENKESVRKLFVGGIRDITTSESLKDTFEQFGKVVHVELMMDKQTGRHRGFAFISYEDSDSVDKAVLKRHLEIDEKMVEVKKAESRQQVKFKNNMMGANMGMNMNSGGNMGKMGMGMGNNMGMGNMGMNQMGNMGMGNMGMNQMGNMGMGMNNMGMNQMGNMGINQMGNMGNTNNLQHQGNKAIGSGGSDSDKSGNSSNQSGPNQNSSGQGSNQGNQMMGANQMQNQQMMGNQMGMMGNMGMIGNQMGMMGYGNQMGNMGMMGNQMGMMGNQMGNNQMGNQISGQTSNQQMSNMGMQGSQSGYGSQQSGYGSQQGSTDSSQTSSSYSQMSNKMYGSQSSPNTGPSWGSGFGDSYGDNSGGGAIKPSLTQGRDIKPYGKVGGQR